MLRIRILYIFVLIACVLSLSYGQLDIPNSVIRRMASREMRHHHYLWHQIRNLWDRFDSNTQRRIRNLGWAPPRPALRYNNGVSTAIGDNNSGEDFLYMHRQMIEEANSVTSSWRVSGWESIPAPNSRDYPVPPEYSTGGSDLDATIRQHKRNDFFYNTIRPREQRFKDPRYLRTLTLGQLGSQLEFSIHSWLHTRFSGRSSMGYRARTTRDPLPDVSTRWDNTNYDWLVDSYASGVNPYFWKIHGWVDDRINDWMRANNVRTLRWRGTWLGGPMSRFEDVVEAGENVSVRTLKEDNGEGKSEMGCGHESGNEGGKKKKVDVMKELTEILLETGLESTPCDKVVLEEDLKVSKKKKSTKSKK